MFSVIIPLYNKATYVEKAIRSVLNQTYQESELIVVNDGSTDDPFKNLEFRIQNSEFNELTLNKKIRIINQENQGVSTARNNGVKVANYDYIAFLDADDWWEPTYLEEMKGLIETFPEAGIYGTSYYKVKNGKMIRANIGVEEGFVRGSINYCKVYANTMYQPLWTGATILKKTIFESEQGFKPALKLGEDFDLWLRVAMKYPVAFLNKPLAYYNQDVELANRAIGEKYYKPREHMLFTDYGELNNNNDFKRLYEVLAVYGLLPYYLFGKNKKEVDVLLSGIHWKDHAFKYRLYYLIFPKFIVKFWFCLKNIASKVKSKK
ncbi:MAG: glycosyltransferase family 2 protein [Bacteroidota bacterium]|nr:glycosyltransferase family 2 protein [Bacteroidota bacterium]